jgi:hypothetical protein
MELIIGSNINALLHCFQEECNLIYARSSVPSLIDKSISLNNKKYNAIDLWKRLYFLLSVSGKILFFDKVEGMRIEDKDINIFTKRARKYTQSCDKFYIYDDYQVYGLSHLEKENQKNIYTVRDWLSVRSGMKHDFDILKSDDNFISELIFYPSERIDGNHDYKDAVGISYLTKENLSDYEFSDVSARFKATYMMKEAGIRGTRNGRDPRNKEKYKYYAVKVESANREIITPSKIYESTENYIFKNNDDIIDAVSDGCSNRIFRKYI